ncbi:MAG: hypothetical protein IIB57_06340, partial [Planctomycetes bacterium]|nr:hypothetical protein [Planctomycetota bacterium]
MVTRWKKELGIDTLRTGLARARLTVSLGLLAGVFTHGGAFAATRIVFSSLNANFGSLATMSCTTDADCVDSNACLQETCAEGICEFHELPNCVPCFDPPTCPPVDIVFLMDTSGSMVDEATALCQNVNQIVSDLAANGVLVTPYFLGITETPAEGFDCLTDDVVTMLGGAVPGDAASCPFPDTFSAHESWGPATAIVAERFPWGDAVVRMIVPISDEGPCDGSFPDGCNDPGDDRDSITNAVAVANANDVIVSPISGTSSSQCVLTLASALATGTGGMAFASQDPNADLAAALIESISDVCEPAPCDDGNICTGDDLCVDGVCEGTTIADCCRTVEDCDDDNICTDDACADGICQSTTIPDCCRTVGDCDDDNACTDDTCVDDMCQHAQNFDSSQFCCDPVDAALAPIDDGETCTDDICDPVTGEVTHSPTEEQIACDDGDICTGDSCNPVGGCVNTPLVPCCGNQVVEQGEECDPPDGQTCDINCMFPICPGEGGPCDEDNGTPGCDCVQCCVWVCATDPWCCGQDPEEKGYWDGVCASNSGPNCPPSCTQPTQTIMYVDPSATAGQNDGTDWPNAFLDLKDALARRGCCNAPPVEEIWVAQGTYKPDQDEAGNVTPGDRSATFQLKSGVALYGGYAGLGTPDPDLRDVALHETILSGDLSGDDTPVACVLEQDCFPLGLGRCSFGFCWVDSGKGENSYHVVTGNLPFTTASIDGFTITGGNADGPASFGNRGAGMTNQRDSSLTVNNCTFSGNSASGPGAGMYNDFNVSITVSNSTFTRNSG